MTVPQPNPDAPGLMTVKDAAELLAISPFTLYTRIARGTDGLGGRKICGRPRVLRAAVIAEASRKDAA